MDESLPQILLRKSADLCSMAHDRNLSLAVAESCTGGLLASFLTDLKGLSHVFERGFVVYSEKSKCDLLGIDPDFLDACGAVSRNVAEAMARGALQRSAADVVVAITGFAGPAGEDEEEGLVHLACIRAGFPLQHREEHFGKLGREGVRNRAAEVALDMMIEAANL